MQVVKIMLLVAIISSCAQSHLQSTFVGGKSEIKILKSKKGNTSLTGQFFNLEYPKEVIPAYMNINGVNHLTDSGKFNFFVLPGKYRVEGGFIGKKWHSINKLKIQRGDSIILKIYLENDNTPLY